MDSPSPPDPQQTADAQTASNKETAAYQAALNSTNQITPYGSLTYSQNGTWSNGAPRYTATQSLSPQQLGILRTNEKTQRTLADIGLDQSGKVRNILNTPFDLNAEADNRYNDLARARLDPQWDQRAQQNEQDLINRGIRPGSEAYDTMQNQFNQNRNDAYNSMYLQGKQLFDTEATAQRNQPLNEISALMSGSQLQAPNFVSTPQTGVANTDVAGITQNAYNAQAQQQSSMMGGLFGLAAAPFGMFKFSDRRMKRDIKRIGTYPCGVGKYEFRYKWGGSVKVGAMADEVERVMPAAVFDIGGVKAVRYDMLEAA